MSMDMQTIISNAVEARRAKRMLTSDQLTIGELILKLEAVDQGFPVTFDHPKYKPTALDSWRGSYSELAIQYEGGGACYEQPRPDCKKDEFGYHEYNCPCGGCKKYSTSLPDKPKVSDLLSVLKIIVGKHVVGYKGGDFTMGKTTPVWVANYGEAGGFKLDEKNEKYSQGVVDVIQEAKKVVLVTKLVDY